MFLLAFLVLRAVCLMSLVAGVNVVAGILLMPAPLS
jgi:hypothetical protein